MKKKTPLIIMGAVGLCLSFAAGITFSHKAAIQPQIVCALDDHCDHDIALNNDFFSPAADHGWTSNAYDLPEGSYYFEEDVTITDDRTLNIPDGVTVSICLNGKTIKDTRSFNGFAPPLFDVKGGGKLNIFDCGTDEHKYSMQEEGSGNEKYTRAIVDDALPADSKTFTGGYFTHFIKPIIRVEESTKSGDGLVWAGGSILAGKNFSQLETYGNLSITKGNFIGNDTGHDSFAFDGSVVFVGNKGKATLGENVLFADNMGGAGGICVNAKEGSKVSISSTFKNNKGGGSTVSSTDEISLSKAVFQHNSSIAYPFDWLGMGAAVGIYRQDDTVTTKGVSISDCTFEYNDALKQDGGAISFHTSREVANAWKENSLAISNCTFDHNSSEFGGGAISFMDSSGSYSGLNISGSTFKDNFGTSDDYCLGGAISYSTCTSSDSDDPSIIHYSNGTLYIDNSTFTNNHARYGGGIALECGTGSTLKTTLYDVTMTENEATFGGAVSATNGGNPENLLLSLQEYCSITDNTAATYGGGIYAKNAIIEVNDHTAVKDNKVGEADNNIWLAKYVASEYNTSERGAFINVKYKLRNGASIGVSMEEPGDFTYLLGTTNNGLATEALEYFFSDDENYEVEINETNNQLTLSGGPAEHVHNWSYSASGATITATCTGGECPDSPISITIIPPANLAYDGTAKKAMLESTKSWSGILTPGTMKYFKGSQEVSECIEPGTYTAKYTMGGATATLDFTITGGGDTPTTNPTIVDPNNNDVSVEFEENVDVTNVELRVEVRAQVKEKDDPEQYNIIVKKLGENEEIAKVYDVRLIRKVGDVETEIQPSDLKPGLKLKVHMAIPEGLDVTNMRILHIHSLTDMEFVSNYVKEGNDLVFEISKLSQFAFIKKVSAPAPQPQPQPTKSGLPAGAVVGIVLGSILLLCLIAFLLLFFVFAKFIIVKDKDGNDLIVRAIKLSKEKQDNQDDKEYFKLMTFKFKKELRVEDEIFNKKKDAEEFVDEQQGLSKNIDDRK